MTSLSQSNADARFSDSELTVDAFLGGAIRVQQPRAGYRAGVDPVFLAAAIGASQGQTVLELGCGAGVASLCLLSRVPGLEVTGVELQPPYAALARANAERNAMPLDVITADLRDLPDKLRARSFDHVMMNPPYFDRSAGSSAKDGGRDIALGGNTSLAQWLDTGIRRLKPGGSITVIQRVERLPDVLHGLDHRVGAIEARPLAPRLGKAARLVLVSARKGARAPFRLHPSEVLHHGATHVADGEDYTPTVSAVLRRGAAWPWTED